MNETGTQNETRSHTFSVLVDNETGVLHRVVGLFSGRGYNIDSLTVSEVDPISSQSSAICLLVASRLRNSPVTVSRADPLSRFSNLFACS